MIRFVGDIHGKQLPYLKILEGCERSIQVGDFGMGFGLVGKADFVDSQIGKMSGEHSFIRGNHDDPAECAKSKHWIKDGTVIDDMMFVGGADSIDKEGRTIGRNWWEDEQLSYIELNRIIDIYWLTRPRIMVTHDAPSSVVAELFGIYDGNRTRMAFQTMFEMHKPDIWIFGHWHKSKDVVIDGTRFICLKELQHIDLK